MRVSNRLDSDQAQQIVWPDLGPNCLPWLSVDNTKLGPAYDNGCFLTFGDTDTIYSVGRNGKLKERKNRIILFLNM